MTICESETKDDSPVGPSKRGGDHGSARDLRRRDSDERVIKTPPPEKATGQKGSQRRERHER